MAPVGAALTLVFWCVCHASAQLSVSLWILKSAGSGGRRVFTLCLGLFLPYASLLVVSSCLGLWGTILTFLSMDSPNDRANRIPALYWPGMRSAPGGLTPLIRFTGHSVYTEWLPILGLLWYLPWCAIALFMLALWIWEILLRRTTGEMIQSWVIPVYRSAVSYEFGVIRRLAFTLNLCIGLPFLTAATLLM